jgi:hypothetical protein
MLSKFNFEPQNSGRYRQLLVFLRWLFDSRLSALIEQCQAETTDIGLPIQQSNSPLLNFSSALEKIGTKKFLFFMMIVAQRSSMILFPAFTTFSKYPSPIK